MDIGILCQLKLARIAELAAEEAAAASGGFAGATINGTDTKHTSVYRNGIPVNDTGAGWYDFGTDLPMWQSYLISSGPNSVLFGSSSMAGTIIMEDDYFEKGIYLKGNIDQQMLLAGNTWLQLGRYGGTRGSVKIDNTEEDWYENTTLKTLTEWKGFKFKSVITDYKYDYDDCLSADIINTVFMHSFVRRVRICHLNFKIF